MRGESEVSGGGALNLISSNYPDHGHHGRLPLSRKNSRGRAGNRTRDLMVSSQELWPPKHEAGQNFINVGAFIFHYRNANLCLHWSLRNICHCRHPCGRYLVCVCSQRNHVFFNREKLLCSNKTGYRRILPSCVSVRKGRSTLMWVRITEVITSIEEINNEFFDHQHHHLCTD